MQDLAPVDWRLALTERRRRYVHVWFWSIAAVTFAVLVVGGITRLTLSGLSIVEWQPLLGIIPPLSEAQWLRKRSGSRNSSSTATSRISTGAPE
jgi:hypothetical protein